MYILLFIINSCFFLLIFIIIIYYFNYITNKIKKQHKQIKKRNIKYDDDLLLFNINNINIIMIIIWFVFALVVVEFIVLVFSNAPEWQRVLGLKLKKLRQATASKLLWARN